jgi:predicted dinucleotide-binding enzyme
MFRARLEDVLRQHADALNQAAGGQLHNVVSVSASYAAGTADHIILVSPAGTLTVTLPAALDMLGKRVVVKRANNTTHVVTIDASSGTIDGAASVTLTTAWQRREVVSDGSNYFEVT